MSAFIKLGYNSIPRLATTLTAEVDTNTSDPFSSPGSDASPVENLFYGGSTVLWKSSDSTTYRRSRFTLRIPSTQAALGVTFIAIRGLNLMFKNGSGNLNILIEGSNDNFSSSATLYNNTGITESALKGPNLEDYFDEVTDNGNTYRDFRITIQSTNSIVHRYRKIYLGPVYDFEKTRSPFYPYQPGFNDNGTPFTADSGALFKTSMGRRARMGNLRWRGCPDSERIFIENNIAKYSNDYPVFIYQPAGSDHEPLSGDDLVFAWCTFDYETNSWKNNNIIGMNYLEDIVG